MFFERPSVGRGSVNRFSIFDLRFEERDWIDRFAGWRSPPPIANPAGLISIVLCEESFTPQPVAVSIRRRTHQ
ncbi:hypothetical protein QT972_03965 [Microcoleus sp. herbarium7]